MNLSTIYKQFGLSPAVLALGEAVLADLEEQNQVLAFVELGLSEKEAREMEPALRRVPNVRDVHFISDQEAAAAFRARYEDDELFQGLPDDNFSHRYAIDLVDIGYMGQTCEALDALPHIDKVNAYEDEAAGFITIRNVAGVVCVVLIGAQMVALVSLTAGSGSGQLWKAGREKEADIVLYGHTHTALQEYREGLWLLNPGSVLDSSHTPAGYLALDLTLTGVVPVFKKF